MCFCLSSGLLESLARLEAQSPTDSEDSDLLRRHYNLVHGKHDTQKKSDLTLSRSAGRAPFACSNCAKNKTKCDQNYPCGRCAKRKLECKGRPTTRNRRYSTAEPTGAETVGDQERTDIFRFEGPKTLTEQYQNRVLPAEPASTRPLSKFDGAKSWPDDNTTVGSSDPERQPASEANLIFREGSPVFGQAVSHLDQNPALATMPEDWNTYSDGWHSSTVGYPWPQDQTQLNYWEIPSSVPSWESADEPLREEQQPSQFQPSFQEILPSIALKPTSTMASSLPSVPTTVTTGEEALHPMELSPSISSIPSLVRDDNSSTTASNIAHNKSPTAAFWSAFRSVRPDAGLTCPPTGLANLRLMVLAADSDDCDSKSGEMHDVHHYKWAPSVSNVQPATRDRLMAVTQMLYSITTQGYSRNADYSATESAVGNSDRSMFVRLPSSEVLEMALRAHGRAPIANIDLFPRRELDVNELVLDNGDGGAGKLLALAMIAHGAMALSRSTLQSIATGLLELCVASLIDTACMSSPAGLNWRFLHAAFVTVASAAWSGDKWLMDKGQNYNKMYASMLRSSSAFGRDPSKEKRTNEDASRQDWHKGEYVSR